MRAVSGMPRRADGHSVNTLPATRAAERSSAALLARAGASGTPRAKHALTVVDAQRMLGNAAVTRLVLGRCVDRTVARAPGPELRGGAVPAPVRGPDTELYLNDRGRLKPVNEESLASYVASATALGSPITQRVLVSRLLSSHEFSGSEQAKRYWAAFVQEHGIEYLRGLTAEKVKAEHDQAQKELRTEFSARVYEGDESFGSGFFHVSYTPLAHQLVATVTVNFDFRDSDEDRIEFTDVDTPHPQQHNIHERLRWSADEEDRWRKRFTELVEQAWSVHVLECHKPGWESLTAKVKVKVVETTSEPQADGRIFAVEVYRGDLPATAGGRSNVKRGRAQFTRGDVDSQSDGSPLVIHEFGHMLGLGDEYLEPGQSGPQWARHSGLVEAEFGYGVPRLETRDDRFKDSIMFRSGTGRILTEHGVLFLDAIRRITQIQEWKLRRSPA
jgi:hypothetical protein